MFLDPDFLYSVWEFWWFCHKLRLYCIFLMCMCETALFLLPVWNLASPFCSSTLISYMMREFRQFANIYGRNWHIYVFMDFRTFCLKWWFWGKIEEGMVRCWPPLNSFLLLGVVTSVPLWRNVTMRVWTDRHAVTETNWIYNLSHAIWYSYGGR